MIGGTTIRVLAVVISAVFVVGSWIATGTPETAFLKYFSAAVLACTIVVFAWDKWLWKLQPFQMLPGVARDISGTWETTLESLWIDPRTGKSPASKIVYVVIRQTSAAASVTLISNESKSKSTLARVISEDGSWLVHYVYTNEPQVDLRARSPIHHGSGVLSVVGSPVKRLSGSYWTDRESKGKLTLNRRSRKLADDFEDGVQLFAS